MGFFMNLFMRLFMNLFKPALGDFCALQATYPSVCFLVAIKGYKGSLKGGLVGGVVFYTKY